MLKSSKFKSKLAMITKLTSKIIIAFLITFIVLGSFFSIINILKSFNYLSSTLVNT